LASEVNVSISSLERLSGWLAETLPMLDRLRDENDEKIAQTKQKIDLVLDEYTSRKLFAHDQYHQAFAELEYAQRNYDYIPDSYYRAVAEAEVEYHRLCECCDKIKKIKDDFENECAIYEKEMTRYAESYRSMLKKGDSFLERYAELLKLSRVAIDGHNAVTGSANNASASTINNSTKQTWKTNSDGTLTFNAPVETGQMLDSNQGKVSGYWGTCGLVSCANVLRMAGKNADESQMVSFASSYNVCGDEGGTNYSQRQFILSQHGIGSTLQAATIENIDAAIAEGRGVIASVRANDLWQDPDASGLHAITITSVKRDRAGDILGFYVCDSGTGGKDSAKYYSADHIKNSLSGRPLNVTSVIR
jgi:hypothetical protein